MKKIYKPKILKPNKLIQGSCNKSVGDFWSWAYSDILNNRNRGIFAEFIVGSALKVVSEPRIEWDSVDLKYKGKGIEVKSSSYLQSWKQNGLSKIVFDVAKKLPWDAQTNKYGKECCRPADCYVFCVYTEKNPSRVDVLALDKWEFYVVSTAKLEIEIGNQKSLSLSRLTQFVSVTTYPSLKKDIEKELGI